MLDHPSRLVATALIGNECANVLISNILAQFYNRHFDSWTLITAVNLFTVLPMIVIFGEITPKVIAAQKSVAMAKFTSPFVWISYKLFFPLRILIEGLVNAISKLFGVRYQEIGVLDESDFLGLIEDSKRSGVIGDSEKELIENIFELDDDKVSEVASPISEYTNVHKDAFLRDIIPLVKDNAIYRTPVIGDAPNEIVGVLYTKDLLIHAHRDVKDMRVHQIMKEPVFMEPNMPLEKVFKRLRQRRVHIAFLSEDEKTATAVITMEDILEHIFGEIWEADPED
jgi:putative hemolysin